MQRAVQTHAAVVDAPGFDWFLCFGKAGKPVLFGGIRREPSVEVFDNGVRSLVEIKSVIDTEPFAVE